MIAWLEWQREVPILPTDSPPVVPPAPVADEDDEDERDQMLAACAT